MLVVYYSRTGTTRKVAEHLRERLGADIEEVVDKKNRGGPIGWLMAGKDAGSKSLTQIEEIKKDPSKYKLVVIGTPVWNNTMSTPIRTYLTKHRELINELAIFSTGEAENNKALADIAALVGKTPKATLKLMKKQQVETGGYISLLEPFIDQLRIR
jgi:flavodoxin